MPISRRSFPGALGAGFAAALAAALPASAAQPAAPAAKPAAAKPAAAPKLPADVLAQVNGENITRADLLSTLDRLGGQPLLRQMITATLIEQEARRLGVTVTPTEIQKQLDETKQQVVTRAMMQGSPGTFAEIAAREGVTEGLLRWSIRQRLLAQKAYAKSIEKSTPVPTLEGQIQASHILIATTPQAPGVTPPTDEEAKKKAEGLLADIRAGKIKFEDAAKQSSNDPGSAAQGGSLGWFGKGQMVPEFSNAAFALAKPGDVSELVKTQFGYHIIRLDKKGSEATAADKSAQRSAELARATQNPQGMSQWVAGLQEKAKIRTNPAGRIAPPAAAVGTR